MQCSFNKKNPANSQNFVLNCSITSVKVMQSVGEARPRLAAPRPKKRDFFKLKKCAHSFLHFGHAGLKGPGLAAAADNIFGQGRSSNP